MAAEVVLLAMNFGAPITSLWHVLPEISLELDLSTVLAGLLTTIPVLAFGLLSGAVSRLARRYRIETLLFASMILLTVGLLVRPGGTIPLLYTGAALIGCGITVGNVLMPAYLKERFPHALGWMTGLYAGFMNLFAALASGFSLRLGQLSGLGWEGSVGIWAILAVLAVVVWLPLGLKRRSEERRVGKECVRPCGIR